MISASAHSGRPALQTVEQFKCSAEAIPSMGVIVACGAEVVSWHVL